MRCRSGAATSSAVESVAAEHHTSDVPIARLPAPEASRLYRLARSTELLPDEALALQGHLLWETGRMSAADGMTMGLFPPAGFTPRAATGTASGDRGVADRVRPCWPTSAPIRTSGCSSSPSTPDAYTAEILPLAADSPSLAAVPPTRFADDPAVLRAVRVAAIDSEGVARSLGVVDDMSGPFALTARHRLGRRLDAGALAEIVVAGRLTEEARLRRPGRRGRPDALAAPGAGLAGFHCASARSLST